MWKCITCGVESSGISDSYSLAVLRRFPPNFCKHPKYHHKDKIQRLQPPASSGGKLEADKVSRTTDLETVQEMAQILDVLFLAFASTSQWFTGQKAGCFFLACISSKASFNQDINPDQIGEGCASSAWKMSRWTSCPQSSKPTAAAED